MTVASEVSRNGPYTGNGVTTVFGYDFRVLDAAHIRVLRTEGGVETTLTLGADYTVGGVGDTGGGAITTTVPPTTSQKITILRNVPFTQETDLENQGAYFAETIEASLDLAAMRDQQLSERLDRAAVVPASADPAFVESIVADIIRLADSADNIDAVANIKDDVSAVAAIVPTILTVADDRAAVAADLAAVTSIYDELDDRYLGAKATAPTTDNDGNPLLDGALYYHTGAMRGMRVWNATTTTWEVAYNPAVADASTISNTPSGGVSATTVQNAINELDADLTTAFAAINTKTAGPASSVDKTAARYDGATGKLLKGSALLIEDTTGALSRQGGGGILIQGMSSNAAAVPAGCIGEIIRKTKTMANPDANFNWVPVLTGVDTVWNSIVLTAGVWLVCCQTGVFGNPGVQFSHMHASFGVGVTSISTSPGNGDVMAFHLTSNHSNGWIFPHMPVPFYLPSGGTINAVAQVDFTGAPITAALYGTLQAIRIA